MRAAFDPPLSTYAGLTLPRLVLRGDRTHPALATSAEILGRPVPNASLVTVPGAKFMIATCAEHVDRLMSGQVTKSAT
jgi:hypothetical protein